MKQRTVPFLIALAAALALAGCGATRTASPAAAPAAPGPAGEATQTSEGGQVTVTATWDGRAAGPAFMVALNTHSVALDAIDLQQLATLRVDGVSVQPTGWDAPKVGHHRAGTLSFPATTSNGQPLIGPQTSAVELIIRDVAGVPERFFHWTAGS